VTSVAVSDNQLPNRPSLLPQYQLSGATYEPSADINSYLNSRDYLGIFSLVSAPTSDLSYQLAYSAHYITQAFNPDNVGELVYQGVASTHFTAISPTPLKGTSLISTGHIPSALVSIWVNTAWRRTTTPWCSESIRRGSSSLPSNPFALSITQT
jgi:hypothetical protein